MEKRLKKKKSTLPLKKYYKYYGRHGIERMFYKRNNRIRQVLKARGVDKNCFIKQFL